MEQDPDALREGPRAMVPSPPAAPLADPWPRRLALWSAPGVLLDAGLFTLLLAAFGPTVVALRVLLPLHVVALGIATRWLAARRSTWTPARRLAYGLALGAAALGYAALALFACALLGSLVYYGLLTAGLCGTSPQPQPAPGGCH